MPVHWTCDEQTAKVLRTNQRPECKICKPKKTTKNTQSPFFDSVPPALVIIIIIMLISCVFFLLLCTFRTYGRFTMDVILTSAFGVQATVQTDPNNEYTRHAETLLQAGVVSPLASKIHLPAQHSRFFNTPYHYNNLIIIISVSQ